MAQMRPKECEMVAGEIFRKYRMWGESDVRIFPVHSFLSEWVEHQFASEVWQNVDGYVSWIHG